MKDMKNMKKTLGVERRPSDNREFVFMSFMCFMVKAGS